MNEAGGRDGPETASGFRPLGRGIAAMAALPRYGRQDLGYSPGGAMDCFSLRRGNRLLGNPDSAPALEMIAPPEIEILVPGAFVLTGARRRARRIRGAEALEVEHSRVYHARAGDHLSCTGRDYGFRTYFCFRAGAAGSGLPDEGKAIPFAAAASWTDPRGRIRVLPGPEHSWLESPDRFLQGAWRTTARMDRMGMRLDGPQRLACRRADMVSAAVADGTVQWTPEGPIVLLRHRQTTGGYPRIFNVITADIDLLGQYGPGERVRFLEIGLEEARAIAAEKEALLDRFRG